MSEYWPIVSFAALVVFSAGAVVEKIRNGKFVHKDVFAAVHRAEAQELRQMREDLAYIRRLLDEHLIQVKKN